MRRTRIFHLVLVLYCSVFVSSLCAQGIRGVTRRVIMNPTPGVVFTPSTTPVVNTVPAPMFRAVSLVPVDAAKAEARRAEVAQKTLAFQQKRAEEGSAYAQYDLGIRYLKGDGVEKDEAAARKWLGLAAAGGNQQATKKLEALEKSK